MIPTIFNQLWNFSFHLVGPPSRNKILDKSNVYFKPGSHRQELRVQELEIFYWYLQIVLEM